MAFFCYFHHIFHHIISPEQILHLKNHIPVLKLIETTANNCNICFCKTICSRSKCFYKTAIKFMTSSEWKFLILRGLTFPFFRFFFLFVSFSSIERIMIIKHFKRIKQARERIINSTIRIYANASHNSIAHRIKMGSFCCVILHW